MIRIEIIAVGKEKIYSVGNLVVTKKKDVYQVIKFHGSDTHISRHASGETHFKSREGKFIQKIRKGVPIKDFKGIEFLGTTGFGLDSLPELFSEYKMKRCNGVFAFDMREYKNGAFNMSIAILTEDGLPKLYESYRKLEKRQIYLFTDCHPMIAIIICDAKKVLK